MKLTNYPLKGITMNYEELIRARYYFIVAFMCGITMYGFELTHFSISIDEEFTNNFAQTISLGRWGHAILREYFLPEPFLPFFTPLLSILALSASASIFSLSLGVDRFNGAVISSLFIAMPQFAYQMVFANQSDTVAISFLLSSLSVYAFRYGGNKLFSQYSALSLAFYVLACSIYQSAALIPVSMIISCATFDTLKDKVRSAEAIKSLAKFSVIAVSSVIIYFLISKAFQAATGFSNQGYLDTKIGWLSSDPTDSLLLVARCVYEYMHGLAPFGISVYSIAFISAIGSMMLAIAKGRSDTNLLLLILLSVLSPFILNLVFGGVLPERAMTSLSVGFSSSVGILLVLIGNKLASLVISAIILLMGSASSNKILFSDYASYQADVLMANRIVSAIYVKYPDFDQNKTPVYFHGAWKDDRTWPDKMHSFGNSFFSWDGGKNRRIMNFMAKSGVAQMHKVSNDKLNGLDNDAKEMPVWPNPESIEMNNGSLIIKLGNDPSRD